MHGVRTDIFIDVIQYTDTHKIYYYYYEDTTDAMVALVTFPSLLNH